MEIHARHSQKPHGSRTKQFYAATSEILERCKYCGSPVKDINEKFCRGCGAPYYWRFVGETNK